MTTRDLLDKYRYINVGGTEWYMSVYEVFEEQMASIGIKVDEIYFSGFSSQGDGACFEGRIMDWKLFLPTVGVTNEVVTQFIGEHWGFAVRHSGHYWHENCTAFECDMPSPGEATTDHWFITHYSPYAPEDIRSAAWLAVLTQHDLSAMHNTFTGVFKNHMRQLYRELEEEYDYLTSDEAVRETLEANELEV